jgi:hypothetical protein
MKKFLLIALVFMLAPMLFASDVTSRTVDGSVRVTSSRVESVEKQMPKATGRQSVLFVQDPGSYPDLGPPMPDQWWGAVLDSVIPGDFTVWGPTTGGAAENGPDSATMAPYTLVIWNTYDWWDPALGAALTATDRTNLANYLTAGGKVWLIGQDVMWSGTPLAWMTANFDLQSVSQDYGGGFPSGWYWFDGQAEIAADSFQTMDDWGSDFFPDHLTPTANGHRVLRDRANPSYYPAILRNDYTSSFWTVDGRQPSPWAEWQDIVYTMLDLFGVFGGDVNDVRPVSIDITSPLPWNTILPPQATVKNLGTVMETFEVTCEIEPGGYSSTDSVIDLAAGDSIQVTFTPDFTFAMEDTYTVTVYTQLSGDMDTSNDTMVAYIETYDPGIAEGGSLPEVFSSSVSSITKGLVTIQFGLPTTTTVELTVYDALGRMRETLVSDTYSAGTHSVDVQLNLPAGVYFYRMETGLGIDTNGKIILVD